MAKLSIPIQNVTPKSIRSYREIMQAHYNLLTIYRFSNKLRQYIGKRPSQLNTGHSSQPLNYGVSQTFLNSLQPPQHKPFTSFSALLLKGMVNVSESVYNQDVFISVLQHIHAKGGRFIVSTLMASCEYLRSKIRTMPDIKMQMFC